MELKVKTISVPQAPQFNFDELKAQISAKVEKYENLVYTEEQVKFAKQDRAELNKLRKALNDERIRLEKEYMLPFNAFKGQVMELIGIIDKPVQMIDKQLAEFDEMRQREKDEAIAALFSEKGFPAWMKLDQIKQPKWKNASCSLSTIGTEMDEVKARIEADLETINALPEFAFEAADVYKRNLDLNRAIAEGKRMAEVAKAREEWEKEQIRRREEQKQKEAEELAKVIQPKEEAKPEPQEEKPQGRWVRFQCFLTVAQAAALKTFFQNNEIEYKAI